jgi:hypothetical protein
MDENQRKEKKKKCLVCVCGPPPGNPGERLTSIDRVVLVECVPALESIKDSFFVRVQDHL